MEKIPILVIISFSSSRNHCFEKIQYLYSAPQINNPNWELIVGDMYFSAIHVEQLLDTHETSEVKYYYKVLAKPADGRNNAFTKNIMEAKLLKRN